MKQEERFFKEWMKVVDRHVSNLIGPDTSDMPDVLCFQDLHDSGYSPREAAEEFFDLSEIPNELR